MRRLAFLTLITALAAPVWAIDENPYFDAKAAPEKQLADYVDATGTEKLKGITRVLVPQFRVEFQLRSEVSKNVSERNASTGFTAQRNVSVYLHLKGVEDAQLQKITDIAYKNFLKEMAAAGIEVIGPDKLANEPEFAAVLKLGQSSPAALETKDGISHFFAPNGGKVYTLLRQTDKARQGFGSGLSSSFEDMAKEMPKAELALSKKFDAPCMKVLLTIAPGQAEVSGWNGIGILGDAVTLVNGTAEVLPALTMLEESRIVFRSASHSENDSKMFGGKSFFGSKVRDFTQEGDTAIYLKKPLLIADQVSTKKMVETTGAGAQVMNAATTVNKVSKVGGLMGAFGGFVPFGGALSQAGQVAQVAEVTGNHDHHEYTVEADPKMYETAATQEIATVTRLLLTKATQAIGTAAPAATVAKK
ncbi:MAG: hypothetical protein PHY62_11250 [Gallionella sp.]|nr:hypothetical protein [Gallionella sp.]